MAPRAVWKGFLKVGELTCPVSLYTAVSTSERIAFHTINRASGHRVHRQFVDADTGKPVPSEDQVKGYEIGGGQYITLEPEEIAATLPESDKTLAVETFVPCGEIDDVYLDRPYYLAPGDAAAAPAYALIREGLRSRKVAALARAVLFRRVRTVLIRAQGPGLVGTLLNFDYEVKSAADAFSGVSDLSIKGEMLDLARHIITTKMGHFDPKRFEDRYEAALAEVVRAKSEGRAIVARPAPARDKVVDLMAALRESARVAGGDAPPGPSKAKRKTPAAGGKAKAPAAAKPAPQRKAG